MLEKLKTMKAAVLVKQRCPLELVELTLPEVLDVGQVLVRVDSSGICGSQIGEIDGIKGEDRYLPHLLGHEGSGEVLNIGPGVRFVKPGDHVVLHWRKGLGIEAQPPVYSWDGRRVNAGWVTTFNEYAIVSENRVTKVPGQLNKEVASLMGCAVTTGFGVVTNNAKLTIGESVVIFGAGGVGLSIVQACAMVSAYPVIAIDLFDEKLAMALSLGATHIINARNEDAFEVIRQILGKQLLDVFIDNTGVPAVIEGGYELVKQNGRVVLVGVPRTGDRINVSSLPMHFGKRFVGSHGGEAQPDVDIPRYIELYRRGRLRLDEIVTARYSLENINEAIEDVRSGKVTGRCVIRPHKIGQYDFIKNDP